MTRILVLGSTGMLGHMVLRRLSEDPALTVEGTHRQQKGDPLYFDAEGSPEAICDLLSGAGGSSFVINCIGVNKTRISLDDPATLQSAVQVNARFPHLLAMHAMAAGARLIHLSTDGVFSGTQPPYDEDSPADGTDIYGKTKRLGEVGHSNALTIRCSLVGPDPAGHRGLWEWFKALPDGASVVGYANHFWSGVTTVQFAELCHAIIRRGAFDTIRAESALHHFCPNRPLSKYELLVLFQTVLHKQVRIEPSMHAAPPVHRSLKTRFHSLPELFGSDLDLAQAIRDMHETESARPASGGR